MPSVSASVSEEEEPLPAPSASVGQPAIRSSNESLKKAREAVERVFSYYLQQVGRSVERYALTEQRMKKGMACLNECCLRFGSIEEAENALRRAVDGPTSSVFNMGSNPSGKQWVDWIDHLFKSVEMMEKRWAHLDEGTPAHQAWAPSRRRYRDEDYAGDEDHAA